MSQNRYRDSYGTDDPFAAQLQAASMAEAAERRRLAKRHRVVVARLERDRLTVNILIGLAICVSCLAVAVFLGRVPIPDWIVR